MGSSIESIRCLLNVESVKLKDLKQLKSWLCPITKNYGANFPLSSIFQILQGSLIFLPIQFSCGQKELLQDGGTAAYEIRDTIFSMKDDKASGLYGFSALL